MIVLYAIVLLFSIQAYTFVVDPLFQQNLLVQQLTVEPG